MDNFPDYNEILKLTFEEHLSAGTIAKKIGFGKTTVLEFLRRYRNSELFQQSLDTLNMSNEEIRKALYKPQLFFTTPYNNDIKDNNEVSSTRLENTEEKEVPKIEEEKEIPRQEEIITTEEETESSPSEEKGDLPAPNDEKKNEFDTNNASTDDNVQEENNKEKFDYSKKKATLCWDCAKATGFCLWSRVLEPVPGWTASVCRQKEGMSYKVIACPEFIADSAHSGSVRICNPQADLLKEGVRKNA